MSEFGKGGVAAVGDDLGNSKQHEEREGKVRCSSKEGDGDSRSTLTEQRRRRQWLKARRQWWLSDESSWTKSNGRE
jgi:hypothetical protein